MHLFVSYSRVDRVFAERFVTRLRRMFPHDTVWYDEDLHGGEIWWDKLLNQIDACDIFIYLLSNEAVTSPYCQAEFSDAQRLQKPVITVQVRDRTTLPPELEKLQYVDMKNGVDDPDGLTDIGRAINHQLRQLPAEKPQPLWEQRTLCPSVVDQSAPAGQADVDTPPLTMVSRATSSTHGASVDAAAADYFLIDKRNDAFVRGKAGYVWRQGRTSILVLAGSTLLALSLGISSVSSRNGIVTIQGLSCLSAIVFIPVILYGLNKYVRLAPGYRQYAAEGRILTGLFTNVVQSGKSEWRYQYVFTYKFQTPTGKIKTGTVDYTQERYRRTRELPTENYTAAKVLYLDDEHFFPL